MSEAPRRTEVAACPAVAAAGGADGSGEATVNVRWASAAATSEDDDERESDQVEGPAWSLQMSAVHLDASPGRGMSWLVSPREANG